MFSIYTLLKLLQRTCAEAQTAVRVDWQMIQLWSADAVITKDVASCDVSGERMLHFFENKSYSLSFLSSFSYISPMHLWWKGLECKWIA